MARADNLSTNMLDFTLKMLIKLYKDLMGNNYVILGVHDFLQKRGNGKICILRHDVDRRINTALALSRIEHELGVSATYYFRHPKTFQKVIIKEIQALGHEVGYHYEVLSKAKGDYEKAIKIFQKELEEFRKITATKTICAHSNPLSRYDNRTLWDKYNFGNFGIVGEAYHSIDFNDVLYLSDTGRCWNHNVGNIRDKVVTRFNQTFNNTTELIAAINKDMLPRKIMLNIHPNRWSDNLFVWTSELVGQNIKNLIKRTIKI